MPRHTNRLKTRCHDVLSYKALRWMASRATYSGIRGGVEVRLTKRYIADCVCLARFQMRHAEAYCSHSEVSHRRWMSAGSRQNDSSNDFQEWLMVFESKRTRSDFRATFGNPESPRLTPFGNMHWCVTTPGLIKPEELPKWWGLLETRGIGLTEVRMPTLQAADGARLHEVAHEILWNHATNTVELESEVEAAPV